MKLVKIIIANIHHFKYNPEQILSQIAPCYVKKYKSTTIQTSARQELVSGLLLKQYLGIERDNQITYNAYNKPLLVSENKYYNISHSGDYVVLAIADCNVGIDVEKIRKYHEPTVNKVFSTKQKEQLLKIDGEKKDEMFTKIWTEYEAALKLKGTGFGEEWDKGKKSVYNCSIYTFKKEDYFITCATEKKTSIVTKNCILNPLSMQFFI